MIEIIPSLSVYQRRLVKMAPGDYDNPVVYDQDPVEMAQELEAAGIRRIQLVDLDGAKQGSIVNREILKMMAGYTDLEVDFTGGIYTDSDIRAAFENGARYITAATVAAREPAFFASWIVSYGREKMVLAADSRDGKIVAGGWQNTTQIDVLDHIQFFYDRGIKYVKCTDLAKDGKMEGPALDLYGRILDRFPDLKVLASGGVSSVADIEQLEEMGVYGVLIGKAFYDGRIRLADLSKYLQAV